MPATGTATVTGKAGAGLTLTAVVFNNIASFSFDIPKAMLTLNDASGVVTQVSIAAATTITIVLSAASGNYTITVS